MKCIEVLKIIDQKYHSLILEVISETKTLPPECKLSDDSVSVWEDFKEQVKGEHSFIWDEYERMIQGVCYTVLNDLPEDEIKLLWLQSDFFLRHYEDDFAVKGNKAIPFFFVNAELVSHVADELYQRLTIQADEEPLLSENEYDEEYMDEEDAEEEKEEAEHRAFLHRHQDEVIEEKEIYSRRASWTTWSPFPVILYRQVLSIVNDKYDRYVESVVASLKDSSTANEYEDDKNCADPWEEIKCIVQNCSSLDDYYDVIIDRCLPIVKGLSVEEIELLWLHSQGKFDSREEQTLLDKKIEEVADELYSRICDKAQKECIQEKLF